MNNANVRVEATNQITCALGIEESDVFFNEAIVEVTAKVPRDPLTQNVVDGGSHTHTDSRENDENEHVQTIGLNCLIVTLCEKVNNYTDEGWDGKFPTAATNQEEHSNTDRAALALGITKNETEGPVLISLGPFIWLLGGSLFLGFFFLFLLLVRLSEE